MFSYTERCTLLPNEAFQLVSTGARVIRRLRRRYHRMPQPLAFAMRPASRFCASLNQHAAFAALSVTNSACTVILLEGSSKSSTRLSSACRQPSDILSQTREYL